MVHRFFCCFFLFLLCLGQCFRKRIKREQMWIYTDLHSVFYLKQVLVSILNYIVKSTNNLASFNTLILLIKIISWIWYISKNILKLVQSIFSLEDYSFFFSILLFSTFAVILLWTVYVAKMALSKKFADRVGI